MTQANAEGASAAPAQAHGAPGMRFANQAAVTFATQAATQALTVVTLLIMPRIIAPSVKGPADLVMSLSLPLIVFGNLGLASAILYHKDRAAKSIDVVASTALTTALTWGALLAGFCAFFLPNYYARRHPEIIEVWHVALVLATVPLQLATSYLNVTQIVAGRILSFNLIQFLPTFLYVGTFFSLYLGIGPSKFVNDPKLFLTAMVLARVAQWTVSATAAVFLLRKVASFRPQIDWRYLWEALKFGSRPYLRDVFQVQTLTFSYYYLEWIGASGEELGWYSVAATAMTALWQVPETIHMVLANRLVTQHADDRRWFTPIVCRNIFFATFCVAVLIGIAAEAILRFWAPKYLGSVAPLRILLAGSTVFCLYKVLQTDLLARGKKNVVPALAGMTLLLLVSSTVLLSHWLGRPNIVMAAACCASAMATTGIVTLLYYCHVARQPVWNVVLLQREDVALWRGFLARALGRKP